MSEHEKQGGSPFDAKVVLAMVGIGALLFVALLYVLGTGEPNRDTNNGGAHALSKGLTGYAAWAELLETQGHEVEFGRKPALLDAENLLILTPPQGASGEEVSRIIEERRLIGPTIVVLPKWMANRIPPNTRAENVELGWVNIFGASSPAWIDDITQLSDPEIDIDNKSAGWIGMDHTGKLPKVEGQANDPQDSEDSEDSQNLERASAAKQQAIVQWIKAEGLAGMVRDGQGRMLAGYINDDYYVDLAQITGNAVVNGPVANDPDADEYTGDDKWPVVFVAEPDLLNNFGLADFNTAQQSLALVDATLDGYELPIAFDVTLNGLGGSQNLLTLAFTPPFLAATLCLIIAAFLVAWRAFLRFGPALAEGRRIAFGKEQLVSNSAGLINRAKRTHLLADPYINLMRRRIAQSLGIRHRGEAGAIEAAIDAAMASRLPTQPPFSHQAQSLRSATNRNDILRRADALKTLERTLDEQ